MQAKETRKVLAGGLILITLGVLILLNSMGEYSFSKSWPILLIVIGATTLLQNRKDKTGWFIGAAGLVFLFEKNWFAGYGDITRYGMPVLLIVIGAFILLKAMKK